jgi:hypothetical protein
MNQKTAKLLRREASRTGKKSRQLKRDWNAMPGTARHALRLKFEAAQK